MYVSVVKKNKKGLNRDHTLLMAVTNKAHRKLCLKIKCNWGVICPNERKRVWNGLYYTLYMYIRDLLENEVFSYMNPTVPYHLVYNAEWRFIGAIARSFTTVAC